MTAFFSTYGELLRVILLFSPGKPMYFTSPLFWVFFTIVILFYSLFYKRPTLRSAYLFLVSLFFYWKSGGLFFVLLLVSIFSDYIIAWLIYHSKKRYSSRLWLGLSLLINLGMLAYFKYTYFFVEIYDSVTGSSTENINILAAWANKAFGSGFDSSAIILPVGISFFTFQTISYSVDVYRGKLKPVSNIFDFAFYVSFFPQLVAGPIVRAAQFIPQIRAAYSLTRQQFSHALFLIVSGLSKKMIVADLLAVNFVDRVFSDPAAYTGFENLSALYGYSLQIYADFSGYTDIAIGVALLLGFRLPVNFNSPYKAVNLTDFWRRWHISLSSWLRDYLYIPLGGSRRGRFLEGFALLVTMLLGGLWHGANIRFLIWGGMHGVGLIFSKLWGGLLMKLRGGRPPVKGRLRSFISIFITFHFVVFLWLFFRAESWEMAMLMIRQISSDFGAEFILQILLAYKYIYLLILGGFLMHWLPARFKEWYRARFILAPLWLKLFGLALFALLLYHLSGTDLQPFIYFRF